MKEEKENCCQGCKKGAPGKNQSCAARLLMENLKKEKELTKNN